MESYTRPSLIRILGSYATSPVISRHLYVRRINYSLLPVLLTGNWQLSLVVSPFADLFVGGVGYYFLFNVGMIHIKAHGLAEYVFFLLPWFVLVGGIYLLMRDIYVINELRKARNLGMFNKEMPLKITF